MKMTRFSEPQILAILRQAEGGVPVAEVCREHGMSTASFYKWRGSLLIWLDKDMLWLANKAGRRGRPPVFSHAAIQFCLMVKVLFGLPLRQTSGMVASILEMAELDWPVPDLSTLSRRQKTLAVQISCRRAPGPLNLLVDSTGIKFLGDGEWLARKHGTHRRRQYRQRSTWQ